MWDLSGITNCASINSISISDYSMPSSIDCSSNTVENNYDPTIRFYYLVFKVDFLNGCTYSNVYCVQIGQPSVPITSAVVPACDPGNYSLSFTNQAPGVTYNIDWDINNSSNPIESYTYPNLPTIPSKVSHSYPFVNCNNGTAPNYQISITASNSCGFSGSTPANVYVSQAPDAIFSRTPDLDVICQGTQVTYTDNSIAGNYVNPNNGNCSQTYNRAWTHTPSLFGSSLNTVSPGTLTNLGNINSTSNNGPQTFSVTYNQPGNYTIRLIVKNSACGNDTMTKTVCVVPAVQANFNTTESSIVYY
jgi:hypothetical protein